MDATVLAALAAAAGSAVGALATIATTWIAQGRETVRVNMNWKLQERETLYKHFITEASRLVVEAPASSLERPEQLVALYGLLSQVRLVSSDEVLNEADECCRHILDLYRQPNLTAEQILDVFAVDRVDPLKVFSECCRKELLAISAGA